jgi:hypothetical protein
MGRPEPRPNNLFFFVYQSVGIPEQVWICRLM